MNHNHDLHNGADAPITCKDLLGNLSNFIDGELTDDACQELKRHMSGCENCQVVFDTMTRTIYLYHESANKTRLPEDVRGRLFRTLKLDDLLSQSGSSK